MYLNIHELRLITDVISVSKPLVSQIYIREINENLEHNLNSVMCDYFRIKTIHPAP